jgi:sterol desaturase/sphingolipid hydroxylase (fatty acid hydroxylase superfamily)
MIQIVWDTRGYFSWLLLVSAFCWTLERLAPWRPNQKAFRKQWGQDLFWLVLNGHYVGLLLAAVSSWGLQLLSQTFSGRRPISWDVALLANQPLWAQFLAFLIAKDFLEWCIHNLLHRVPPFWEFHKLHHSIVELDWIGNMRFHWMEIVVYRGLTYLPLFLLGVEERVILAIAVFSTLVGHLNHSNLNLDWGILRYVLNSPRLHVWHHDVVAHKKCGQNFGVVFSFWDFLFGTAYFPSRGQPPRLGFEGMEEFPQGLWQRLVYPFWKHGRLKPSPDRKQSEAKG